MICRASSTGVSRPTVMGFSVMRSRIFMIISLLLALFRRRGCGRGRGAGALLLHLGVMLLHHCPHLMHRALHLPHPPVHAAHALHLLLHLPHLLFHVSHHLHHPCHLLFLRPRTRRPSRFLRDGRSQEHGDQCDQRDDRTERFHFLPLPLTVRTGQAAAATTRPATLPRNSFASPERPWVPMTMTSARFDLAKRTICSCATPSSRVPEARTPALFARASSFAICRWAHDRFDAAISSYTFGEMYPSPATGTTGLITCAISSWPRLVLASSMAFRSAAFEAVEKSDG